MFSDIITEWVGVCFSRAHYWWAIITYEETKGAGSGPPDPDDLVHSDDYVPEEGKNVIYHSFDFANPDVVVPGNIMNPPETDASGNLVYLVDEYGNQILDYLGRPQLAYENARRGRFILQGAGAWMSSDTRTPLLMVYKMGEAGHGRPSDIFLSRWEVPDVFNPKVDNPYCFENVQGDLLLDSLSQQHYWHSGPKNMSSVKPEEVTASLGDPEQDDPFGAFKVIRWKQMVGNFLDKSHTNPYDDARAHCGQIRGDYVTMGFRIPPTGQLPATATTNMTSLSAALLMAVRLGPPILTVRVWNMAKPGPILPEPSHLV